MELKAVYNRTAEAGPCLLGFSQTYHNMTFLIYRPSDWRSKFGFEFLSEGPNDFAFMIK